MQQLEITRSLTFHPGAKVVGLNGIPGLGRVFYVNGGSDGPTHNGNSGKSPSQPKRTVEAAVDLCTANYNDIIYVLNYGSNARAVETFPIAMDTGMVHLIGVGHTASKWSTIYSHDTNTAAILVSGHRTEIAGLELGGNGTASGVEFSSGAWGTYVHDCWFGVTGDTAGTNGVYIAAGVDPPYTYIEECNFSGYALTGMGVRITGNCTNGFIVKNVFDMCTAGIYLDGAVGGVRILDNTIAMDADTANHGIYLGASTSGCMICGNRVFVGEASPTGTRALVDATSSSNHWGANIIGDALGSTDN